MCEHSHHLSMSKRVKSQLELYMDGLEGSEEGESLPKAIDSTKTDPTCGPCSGFPWVAFSLCILVVGLMEDSMHVTELIGCNEFKRSGNVHEDQYICFVSARRFVQFLLVASVIRTTVFSASPPGYITWTLYQCNVLTLYLVVLIPVLVGLINYWLIRLMQCKLELAKHNTDCLMSVIKRIQLVRMGSTISHPMPPVAKLEHSFLRNNSHGHVLCCREMRSSFQNALLRLKNVICIEKDDAMQSLDVVTLSTLERLVSKTFYAEDHLQLVLQWEKLQLQLVTIKNSLSNMIGFKCKPEYQVHPTYDISEESLIIDVHASMWDVMSECAECFLNLLSVPLRLSVAISALDEYIDTCKSISGGFIKEEMINQTSASLDGRHSTTKQHEQSTHSYADTYLEARLKLARLRATYDDMSTRLWLADQQLASVPVLQCLLPDQLHTGGMDNENELSERVHQIDSALDTLSNTTRLSRMRQDKNSSFTAPSTRNEILEGVELLLAGLPTLRDFELLCEDLQLIREASLNGSSPAQYKLDRAAAGLVTVPVSDEHDAYAGTAMSELAAPHQHNATTQSVYEANDTIGEGAQLHPGAHNSLDPSQTSSILDVYTTVIPRRVVPTKKVVTDSVDEAKVAQERAQAKKLFRELNQHLRRMHTPVVPASLAQQQPASASDDPGINVDRPTSITTTGIYTHQRVRNIDPAESEDGGFAHSAEVHIETKLTQLDLSAFGLCEDSDSDVEDEPDIQHHADRSCAEVKAYRVGTMLLTEEELQATNLASTIPVAPTHSAQAFQNEMRQALLGMQRTTSLNDTSAVEDCGGGGLPTGRLALSAFASALRSNHLQEATFGDELSDE